MWIILISNYKDKYQIKITNITKTKNKKQVPKTMFPIYISRTKPELFMQKLKQDNMFII